VFSVNKITSTFEAGLFKQTLTLARVANQEIEAAEKAKNKKNLYDLGNAPIVDPDTSMNLQQQNRDR
jgi:hypothetical protein